MSSPGSQVELYDGLSVRFQGGVIGVVSGAGAVPPNNRFQVDRRIFGSEGMLLLDVERERLELRRRDGKDFSLPIPGGEGDYTCDVPPHRFIELIRNPGDRNNSSGEIAARSFELLDACTGYLAHPFKKMVLASPISLSMELDGGTKEPYSSHWLGEEDSMRQEQRRLSGSMRSEKPDGCGANRLPSKVY